MSFSADTHALTQSFARTGELLQQLLTALQTRRAAWASARPRTIEPSPEMERIAQELAGEENARTALLERIRRALPVHAGATPGETHLNVTRIAAAMPVPAARALREAAARTTALAKSVRVEVTLGQRLLRFTQRAQQSLLAEMGVGAAFASAAPGYDRNARMRSGIGAGIGASTGRLVDGKL